MTNSTSVITPANTLTPTASIITPTIAVTISHSVKEIPISTGWISKVYERNVSESVLLFTSHLHVMFFIYIILFNETLT